MSQKKRYVRLATRILPSQKQFLDRYVAERQEKDPNVTQGSVIREIVDYYIINA